MRNREYGLICMFLVLLFPAMQAGAAAAPAAGPSPPQKEEERRLLEQQRRLELKIGRLEQEQEFLLFQKTFQQSDSKYLIIDPAAGRGMLRYRNRILRTFPVSGSRSVRKGPAVLTNKTGGAGRSRTLLFDRGLVLQVKGASPPAGSSRKGAQVLSIGFRDMSALFTALDRGSQIYVK